MCVCMGRDERLRGEVDERGCVYTWSIRSGGKEEKKKRPNKRGSSSLRSCAKGSTR